MRVRAVTIVPFWLQAQPCTNAQRQYGSADCRSCGSAFERLTVPDSPALRGDSRGLPCSRCWPCSAAESRWRFVTLTLRQRCMERHPASCWRGSFFFFLPSSPLAPPHHSLFPPCILSTPTE